MTPAALSLLVARYIAHGRADVRDALGQGLARVIETTATPEAAAPELTLGPTHGAATHGATSDRAQWLMALVEASAISDDERIPPAIESLVGSLRDEWPSRGEVGAAMQAIEASLSAAVCLSDRDHLVAAAIEELERIVSFSYEPGEGLRHSLRPGSTETGTLRDHVAAASALLNAYGVTARLPYSMLAEELMQFARRSWWDEKAGGFWRAANLDSFVANSHAAIVLGRLATLHEDPEYRAVAVIAYQSDYADDCRRTLESLELPATSRGLDVAVYALALCANLH